MKPKQVVSIGMVGGIVAVGVTLGAVSYVNTFWNGHIDYPLPPSPCQMGVERTAGMTVVEREGETWVYYTCHSLDGVSSREWARVYHHGRAGATPTPAPPTVPPAVSCSHIPGFVPTSDGSGCVPPDHPLASVR